MILKKTFYASGSQVQAVAADMSLQIKNYLLEVGLFSLLTEEDGNGSYPKYTLKYKDSNYRLVIQSGINNYAFQPWISAGVIRGGLDATATIKDITYGSVEKAVLSIHIITSGNSMVFKIFGADGAVKFGGSCIRYTDFTGKQGYLYNSNESLSWLGYIGRYEVVKDGVASTSHIDYPGIEYPIIQEYPIIEYGGAAIGYANDIVVINASHFSDSNEFSAFLFNGSEYHGGRITNDKWSWCISPYTAVGMINH